MSDITTVIITLPPVYVVDIGGGAQGPAGPPGANGANGAAGAQGIQGIQGPPGAGSTDASLLVSGTLNPARLSFTMSQLDTAISDGNGVYVGDGLNGTLGLTTPASVAATTGAFSDTVQLRKTSGNLLEAYDTDAVTMRTRITSQGLFTRGLRVGNPVSATPVYDIAVFGGTASIQSQSGAAFIRVSANAQIGWNATNDNPDGTAYNVNLSRNTNGVLQVGTTAANASGSLLLTNLTASGDITCGTNVIVGGVTRCRYYADINNTIAYVDTDTDSTHAWTLINRLAARTVFSVRGTSGQVQPLQEWQVSAGTAVANMSAAGDLTARDISGRNITQNDSFSFLSLGGGNVFMQAPSTGVLNIIRSGGTGADISLRNLTASGTITAVDFAATPVTFAGLPPASSKTGKSIQVSDRDYAIATSNGTNWLRAGTSTVLT